MKILSLMTGLVLFAVGMLIVIIDTGNEFSLLADLIRTSVMLGLPAPAWYGLFMWLMPVVMGIFLMICGSSDAYGRNRRMPIRRRGF